MYLTESRVIGHCRKPSFNCLSDNRHSVKLAWLGAKLPRVGLYLHSLEATESLRRLVHFYVRQHNEVMPHAAFDGQTPDEMYFGRGDVVVVKLAAARVKAREQRIKSNRAPACAVCKSDLSSEALQLQRPRSRMP